jgi:hypothetical protein
MAAIVNVLLQAPALTHAVTSVATALICVAHHFLLGYRCGLFLRVPIELPRRPSPGGDAPGSESHLM